MRVYGQKIVGSLSQKLLNGISNFFNLVGP